MLATHSLGTFEAKASSDQGEPLHARPNRAFWMAALAEDHSLSKGEMALALRIFRHCGPEGDCWPSKKRLCGEGDHAWSLRTLGRHQRGLVERGYLDVQQYVDAKIGRQTPSGYGLRLPNGLRHAAPRGPKGTVAKTGGTPAPVHPSPPAPMRGGTPATVRGGTPAPVHPLEAVALEAVALEAVNPPPPSPPPPTGGGGFSDAEDDQGQEPDRQVLADAVSVMWSVGDARQELGMAPMSDDDYGVVGRLVLDYVRAGVDPVRLCAAMATASRWTRRSIDGQLNRIGRGELRAGALGEYGEPA